MTLDQVKEIADALIKAAIIFGAVAGFGVSIAADVTWLQGGFAQGKRTRGQRWMDMQRRKRCGWMD